MSPSYRAMLAEMVSSLDHARAVVLDLLDYAHSHDRQCRDGDLPVAAALAAVDAIDAAADHLWAACRDEDT
jgi:hypothetical protein